MATILVVGATGMTGRSSVEQLLNNDHKVRVIVRAKNKFSSEILNNFNLSIKEASILELTDVELAAQVRGCDAIVSCLGHVMNFKGMFGEPKNLCTDATRRLCEAIERNEFAEPRKFILMSTVGVKNPGSDRRRSLFDRAVIFLLRHFLPPHRDNETAAEYLYRHVPKDGKHIEWCCVRPDSLINAEVSSYKVDGSPETGIFSGRPTTRANVAMFMTELIEDTDLWRTWKFRMPVITNSR